MAQAEAEWRAGLKVGDLVALHYRSYPACIRAVVHLTRTQIVVPGEGVGSKRRFAKADGFDIRKVSGWDDRTTIHPPTLEQVREFKVRLAAAAAAAAAREARRADHLAAIRVFLDRNPGAVPTDVLERVAAALPK